MTKKIWLEQALGKPLSEKVWDKTDPQEKEQFIDEMLTRLIAKQDPKAHITKLLKRHQGRKPRQFHTEKLESAYWVAEIPATLLTADILLKSDAPDEHTCDYAEIHITDYENTGDKDYFYMAAGRWGDTKADALIKTALAALSLINDDQYNTSLSRFRNRRMHPTLKPYEWNP